MKISHVLTALGINAVPTLGWFFGDWNSGTTLAVYWVETVLSSLFIALRIVFHRRVVRVRGHFRYETSGGANRGTARLPFLKHFLPVMLIFCIGHGLFLAALVFVMTANGRGAEVRLDFHALALGCGVMLGFQVADFLIDLVRMETRPFRWVESMAERGMGRVFVIQLTIMVGMVAGGLSGGTRGFFLVFVILKTMNDLSAILPQYDPEEAPRWLCRLMDKVPNLQKPKRSGFGGTREKSFGESWKEDKVAERSRRVRNEQPHEE